MTRDEVLEARTADWPADARATLAAVVDALRPSARHLSDILDWLDDLAPAGTRLVFFGGKGGVGKTTAAAAASLSLARRGQRVLLLSTDPAHSVADVLGIPVGDQEREVAPRLWARELDAAHAFPSP